MRTWVKAPAIASRVPLGAEVLDEQDVPLPGGGERPDIGKQREGRQETHAQGSHGHPPAPADDTHDGGGHAHPEEQRRVVQQAVDAQHGHQGRGGNGSPVRPCDEPREGPEGEQDQRRPHPVATDRVAIDQEPGVECQHGHGDQRHGPGGAGIEPQHAQDGEPDDQAEEAKGEVGASESR